MKHVVPVKKKGFKPSDIHCLSSACFGDKAPVRSTVFNRERSFDSGKETAQAAALEW